jgi:extracellular elastinolytic metalloproteinase
LRVRVRADFGVHAIGEVWAQFLFVMTENLIAKHGFSSTLFPPTDPAKPNDYYTATAELDASGALAKPLVPKHGNTLAVQLVMNGMKLQPCRPSCVPRSSSPLCSRPLASDSSRLAPRRPSFFDARDAIVQADQILTGGSNACEIWSAFADRGLGPDAALRGATPWGGGIRIEDYSLPKGICKDKKKKDV